MMAHHSSRVMGLAFAMLLALVPGREVHAQEAKVRASMTSQDTVYVGQKVTLAVELLAPGFFASAPAFELPDPQGLMLMPPVGSPVIGSEEIDGVSYTVQRHEVSVLAQHPGELVIPPLTVRFQYKRAPLDKDALTAKVKTPEVKFTATQPPGTEKLGMIITARNLEVKEEWHPDPATAKPKAGDAFTRTITFTAPEVPGMMFPPFQAAAVDGIGIYTKEPVVNDHSERGSLTGQRTDVVTYALQRAGIFTIPAVRFTWWDLESKSARTVDFPARTLTVAANPAMPDPHPTGAVAPQSHPISRKTEIIAVALLLAIIVLSLPQVRRGVGKFMALFRPVHLQPLNPRPRTGTSGESL
ncbi:oxygen tolerance protein BatD [Roseimicrobium gellanilyticum]|uniref:Oxygen tolerance protein BatD n=1 Tax=Roseimicrobium gellanilyticum TaxID=748857 RepID=A0A366H2U8_9BACT|nr:BatD family protein [Roseimicrobium gellanilyticum]RBP35372.1 oxygen tolerance protein BatD [Roseimicrobium gellanilyticum]